MEPTLRILKGGKDAGRRNIRLVEWWIQSGARVLDWFFENIAWVWHDICGLKANHMTAVGIGIVIWFGYATYSGGELVTLAILIGMAGVTDLFDGAIARRRNHVSKFGSFIDKLRDLSLAGLLAYNIFLLGVVPEIIIFLGIALQGVILVLKTWEAATQGIVTTNAWGRYQFGMAVALGIALLLGTAWELPSLVYIGYLLLLIETLFQIFSFYETAKQVLNKNSRV